MLWILIIAAVVYGLVCLLGPEAVWELRERMRYKDSDREPSSAGLVMIRVQGVALIVVAALIAAVKLRWGLLSSLIRRCCLSIHQGGRC